MSKTQHKDTEDGSKREVRYKLQLQLTKKARDRLFALVEKSGAETCAQVVRDALRIYDILVDETMKDAELFLKDAAGQKTSLKLF